MTATTQTFRRDLFDGKVVFVTGGGSGICYGMTRALMVHGCKATIVGRRKNVIEESAAKLQKETGKDCLGLSADVRDLTSLIAAVAATIERFGRLDYVICGAAGNFLSSVDGLSSNAFKTVMDIDTLGTYNTVKATGEHVKKARGSYIAISATLHYSGTFLQAHVSAAKAAIDALFRVLAVEWGLFGVTCNVIAPGPIEGTEGISRLVPKDIAEKSVQAIPVGRNGTIDDIASAGVFLFSPAARYITGACLVVDGGQHHNFAQSQFLPYPETVLAGGDLRKVLAAKL